jgi:cytochrome c biogenesis protein CcmG/thiol:disulfide interchange protein DsbE
MHKAFKVALPAIALTALSFLASCGNAVSESTEEPVQAAALDPKPAPDFSLPDVEGREIKLSDLKGQVVLLNFWATWCGPCKIEMPWFVEFQRQYKDQGFSVVAVSLDSEGWEVVKPFAEEYKLNFPVVVGDDDLADKFGGIAALPTTFIIDKEGRITASHTGLVSKSDYEDEIKNLL